jgi:hypothetical protein
MSLKLVAPPSSKPMMFVVFRFDFINVNNDSTYFWVPSSFNRSFSILSISLLNFGTNYYGITYSPL